MKIYEKNCTGSKTKGLKKLLGLKQNNLLPVHLFENHLCPQRKACFDTVTKKYKIGKLERKVQRKQKFQRKEAK